MKKCLWIAPFLLQVLVFPGQPPAHQTGVTWLEQLVLEKHPDKSLTKN